MDVTHQNTAQISTPPDLFSDPSYIRQHLFRVITPFIFLLAFSTARADTNFTHDGIPQLLFRDGNANNINAMTAYKLSGSSIVSATSVYAGNLVSSDWEVAGTPDLDGDGNADLLWLNNVTGDLNYNLMNGTTVVGGGVIATGVNTAWKIVGTADFNKDGKADILWYNTQTGDLAIWYMNGITLISGTTIAVGVPLDYTPVGLADLNHDGNQDILWYKQAGVGVPEGPPPPPPALTAWLMNGSTYVSGVTISSNIPGNYSVVGVADLDRDGNSDVIWQDTAGNLYTWYLNGTNIASTVQIASGITSNLKMVGMRGNSNDLAMHLNLANGASLSDIAQLLPNVVPTLGYGYADITITVDGKTAGIGGDDTYPPDTNAHQQGMSIPTTGFSNGTHLIALRDRYGNFDSRSVTFNNTLSNISFDSVFRPSSNNANIPSSSHIQATLPSVQSWTLSIQKFVDPNHPTVRQFTGTSSTIDVSWDGKDASGHTLSADTYQAVITPQQGSPINIWPVNLSILGDAYVLLNAEVFGPGSGYKADVITSYLSFLLDGNNGHNLKSFEGTHYQKLHGTVTSPLQLLEQQKNLDAGKLPPDIADIEEEGYVKSFL